MELPDSPHLVLGEAEQVGIITLWTKKEHVLKHIPPQLYAVASQLYSRDEGLSRIARNLLSDKRIRDLVIVGADLNRCAETLIALFENGAENGQVKGAPGYIDTEIPEEAIDRLREHVTIHDLRKQKDYSKVAEYIKSLENKDSWGEPETFAEPRITPPTQFPTSHQHAIRHDSVRAACIEMGHLASRFGALANVQVHLTGLQPLIDTEGYEDYTRYLLESEPGTYGELLHKDGRLNRLVSTLTREDAAVLALSEGVEGPALDLIQATRLDGELHLSAHVRATTLSEMPLLANALFHLLDLVAGELDEPSGTVTIQAGLLRPQPRHLREQLVSQAHVLRRTGDPKSNILIRLTEGRIIVTHLSPEGKRLEEFSSDSARDLYKRLVVEHRVTDLSHAAYLGYELARAEEALRSGGMYEQDA